MAVETFKIMKSRGISSDAVTYSIMTNCCSTMKSARSAYALVSMMIRDGFYPETVTYTSLIKVRQFTCLAICRVKLHLSLEVFVCIESRLKSC